MFTFAVVTVSDTAEDKTGPYLINEVKRNFPDAVFTKYAIISKEKDVITAELQQLCDKKVNLILTIGGIGLSKRDVTPEATKEVIEKEIPGITQTMLIKSLNISDTAMLSRAVAGKKQKSLIINLPDSGLKGCLECFGFIRSIVPYAVEIMEQKEEIKITHNEIGQKANIKEEPQNEENKVRVDQVAMRNRISPYQMLKFEEALNIIKIQSTNLDDVEEINIESSLNRVLATDITSTKPYPPFRESKKDGYAVRAEDGAGERVVKAVMIAGDYPVHSTLKVNEAVRISTGARLPEGADAVVQTNDTECLEVDEKKNEVRIMMKRTPYTGQNIREIGSGRRANSSFSSARKTITPFHIDIFGKLGLLKVKVFKRPSIGLLSIGNELCPYDAEKIPPGYIRDSNKLTLMHLLCKYNYTANYCGIVKQDPDLLKWALATALRDHDVIITTGGVSVGEFELIKTVLKTHFNATIHFGSVDIKPGESTTFATCKYEGSRKLIFALPGHPASATITCRLFVIPALLNYECSTKDCLCKVMVELDKDIYPGVRLEFQLLHLTTRKKYLKTCEMRDRLSTRFCDCRCGTVALLIVPERNSKNEICRRGTFLPAYVLY